ncbi:MAG: thiamine phosphate synthase [Bacteroidota bacterium]
MKIILISPSSEKENEINLVNFFFESGLETYHLRKPKMNTKQLEEYIKQIPEHFHNRIVIHSHHNLAGKFKLKGIHLTKSHLDKPKTTWLKLKLLSYKRSISSLSISQTFSKIPDVYLKTEHECNYIFLRTIFDKLSGKYMSGFYDEGIRAAIEKSGKKIIARGGVDETRILQIHNLGFYGLALYSHIWKNTNPKEAFLNFMEQLRMNDIKID